MLRNIRIVGEYGTLEIDGTVFKLVDGLDLSNLAVDVNYIETTGDGGLYQNSRLKPRGISMEIQIRHQDTDQVTQDLRRRQIYAILNPKAGEYQIEFEDSDANEYYIKGYLTYAPTMKPDKKNNNAAFQKMLVQFICLDPFVYKKDSSRFSNFTVNDNSGFEFPLEIIENQFEFATLTENNMIEAFSNGSLDTGMRLEVEFSTDTQNFRITNEDTGEYFQVTYQFQAGDRIVANTTRNARNVVLYRGDSVINLRNNVTLESTYFQIHPGENNLSLRVTSGNFNNIVCSVSFRERYLGV